MPENSNPEISNSESKNAVDDYGQYHVENHFEMCSILKRLITKPDVITAFYDDTLENFILTSVIAIDTKKGNFILDVSTDSSRNEQFINSERITCKTKCNNIRIEFSIRNIKPTKFNDEDAFSCSLPNNILYLQRREYYRMEIPVGDKIQCKTFSHDGAVKKTFDLSDISSGGIGVNESNLESSHTLFEHIHHCEIDLGEIGTITFDLELRNNHLTKLKNNSEVIRLGYKFTDLETPDNAKIQRYIHSIDMRKKQSK